MNSNKAVIKKMINELGKFKRPQQRLQQAPQQQPPSQVQPLLSSALPIPPRFDMTPNSSKTIGAIDARGSGKKQKIEEIYRADDLQKHRMSELEIRLKEKQEEMDTMLNNKKPTTINFSDSSTNDNKLASDEMEKLLADALSSRQRELEQLVVNTSKDSNLNAEEWITGSNDPVTNALNASIAIKRSHNIKRPSEQSSQTSTTGTTGTTGKKNVSFSEENNEEILYDKDVTNRAGEDTIISRDNLSFLSKLKRTNNSTNCNTIPLDEIMTDYEYDGEGDGDRSGEYFDRSMQYDTLEKTRDAIDSRDYAKLDEKINKMQNYIESIKETQDRILELLSQK
jgi:hypothetical protein